ncbi:sugar phosphate nucleotidyltransferase [uncultured Jatrophihabitans sp.]|uniref:sugar phosphate nucleotidyltransferase n=1 Tax=uncultured Jatrophihabitans sp. TaxID=1610747 RepID=UPI0035CC7153
MSTDAVILVGGFGTRLRPLTLSAPKPMLPTAGVPFLTHLISRLREAGITHVVLGTSYRAEVFEDYFGDGSRFGVDLKCVVEQEALGTGGGIRNVAPALRADTVLVFNGDNMIGVDLVDFVETHVKTDADVTLCLTKVEDARAYGCVPTDVDGRVEAFLEKDPNPVTDQINAGLYAFKRSVIDTIPTGRPVSVEKETFPGLLASGANVRGYLTTSYWRDFGTPTDFVCGSADLVRGIAPSPAVPQTGERLLMPGSSVSPKAHIYGGSTIGTRTAVGAGADIDSSVVFDDARIGAGAVIRRSIIGKGVTVHPGALIEDAVIGDGASIGAGTELRHGARIWPGVDLAEGSIRFSSDL